MTTTPRPEPSVVADLGEDVAAVCEREPFELAEALGALSREDLQSLGAEQAEVVVVATQRLTNALSALQTLAVASYAIAVDEDLERYREDRRREFEARREQAEAEGRTFTERWHPIPGDAAFAASALAPLLHISPRTMATRIARARRVDHEMPATWAAARGGDLEPYRSDAVVRGAAPLEDDDLEEFEARLFAEDVADLSTGQLAARARRAAVATNREAVEEVAERAREKRRVCVRPDPDLPGMSSWRLLLPAETSRTMWAAVEELAREYHRARREAGDPVTLDQARADAVADLLLGQAHVETTVEVVVPVAAMTHSAGHAAQSRQGQGRGQGQGQGQGHAAFFGGHDPHGSGPSAGPDPGSPPGTGPGAPADPHPGTDAGTGPGAPADPDPRTDAGDGAGAGAAAGASAGIYRWAERRSPAEVLRSKGETNDLILDWVSGRQLHRASQLECEYALLLTGHLQVTGNPNLTRHPPPISAPPGGPHRGAQGSPQAVGAWFVPGHVDDTRVGALLPHDLSALLADPDTRVRVTGSDPVTGAPTTEGTDAYRPGRALARRVRRRDGTCRFPGCATPARQCQLDHVTPWPDGATDETNLLTLCATHHGFKHHAGWLLTMTSDATATWTAPTGRSHTTKPRAVHSVSV